MEARARARPAGRRRRLPQAEGDGLLRRAPRQARRPQRERGARAAHGLGVRPVFKRIDTCAAEFASPTAYMYSTYEGTPAVRRRRTPTRRTRPSDRDKVDHPRRRAEPHRPGHRVRLLLLPRLLRAARGRLRDHHGQLQPGDGLDRLRHLRPALFRAADRRGRARDHRDRAAERAAHRRHRAVRRPDAAEARRARSRRPACRSSAPRPTPSTSPRTATASRRCSRSSGSSSRERHRALGRARRARRRRHRLSRAHPPSYVLGGRAMEIVRRRRGRPLRRAALRPHRPPPCKLVSLRRQTRC